MTLGRPLFGVRSLLVLLSAPLLLTVLATPARTDEDAASPPSTYEVLINGESFRVEANRLVKVQSADKAGTSYQLAVRVATTQLLRLNTVQLEYDMPAKVTDDRGRQQRTVRIKHELGFSILLTDLGEALDAKGQEEAMTMLTKSVTDTYGQVKGAKLKIGATHDCAFAGSAGRTTTISYTVRQGEQDFVHTCQACVLSGPKFSVTCLIQYLDNDRKDVLPLVKKTLDSLKARQ